ncbi:MAG: M4 family metallopeptidase, partial [Candidatus Hydrothermarchaeales archaeon]
MGDYIWNMSGLAVNCHPHIQEDSQTTGIHRIQCIVPPHMLKEIAEHGSSKQREWVLRTLKASEQFRGQRQAMAEVAALAAPTLAAAKQRTIYDAENGSDLPGRQVRAEGDPATGDPAVDEAYDGSGATYDLYKDIYGRNSIDGNGMGLDSTVHYQQGYDNAFWNGQQMVYGDGDEDLPDAERLFNRFTSAIDIIGHELTHGVTQHEARLIYWEQPGAINESFSDVFGSMVKQQTLGQTVEEANWLIGEGLFTANVNGQGIRSMKAPGTAYDDPVLGKDPQPAHMRDYRNVDYDNGGVHINSGIPNHAFYVVAKEIGGSAWEKAGQIWYITLRDKLQARSNFRDAARLTFQAAGELFGEGTLEQNAVRKGWA